MPSASISCKGRKPWGRKQSRKASSARFTRAEFLESLRDGREVYIHGERVKDMTTHPAFRNAAASDSRLFGGSRVRVDVLDLHDIGLLALGFGVEF